MTPFLRLIALAGGLAAALSACFSSAPATRLYVLAPLADLAVPPPGAAQPARPVSLVVREVRLPQYLDRPQIVTRGTGHRLLISEFEQWGGSLREDVTRVLAENLGRLLHSDRVVAAPSAVAMAPDYRIEVDLLRFEREADGRVVLEARWWLLRGHDAVLVASPVASFATVPADTSYPALVAAMSTACGDLARAIADSVRKAGAA